MLDSATNKTPKYKPKTWVEVNNNTKPEGYDAANQTNFKNIK